MKNLIDFFKTEEGKKSLDDFCEYFINKQTIISKQHERFDKKFGTYESFDKIVQKILRKYVSDEYKDRWHKRNIEPPEPLCHFLFEYSRDYGRECSTGEWFKFSNEFTHEMYYIFGYYFLLIIGQGSYIRIIKH